MERPNDWREIRCEDCDGAKVVDGERCETCSGRGSVLEFDPPNADGGRPIRGLMEAR